MKNLFLVLMVKIRLPHPGPLPLGGGEGEAIRPPVRGLTARGLLPGKGFLALCLLAALLSGCGKSENKSGSEPAAGKPRIALVMKSLANEFFSTMAEGAKKHQAANAASYDLIVNGIKNENDLAEQVNLVEQMIAQ